MEEYYIRCDGCGEVFKEDNVSLITPILWEHQEKHFRQDDPSDVGWTVVPESEAF